MKGNRIALSAVLLLVLASLPAAMGRNFLSVSKLRDEPPVRRYWDVFGCSVPETSPWLDRAIPAYRKANAAWQSGRRADAIHQWRQTPVAHLLLPCAVVALESGYPTRSASLATLVLQIEPRTERARYVLGRSFLTMGRPQAALEACSAESVMRHSRWVVAACVCAGAAAWESGDWDTSLQFYETAVALDPLSDEGHAGVGRALFELRQDADRAIAQLLEAERLNPASPWYPFLRADILDRAGDAAGAHKVLRDVVERNPEFEPARQKLSLYGEN